MRWIFKEKAAEEHQIAEARAAEECRITKAKAQVEERHKAEAKAVALEANCRTKGRAVLEAGVAQEEMLRSVGSPAQGKGAEWVVCDCCVMWGIPYQVSFFFVCTVLMGCR